MSLWIVDIQPAKRLALDGEAIVDIIRETGHEVIETIYDPASRGFPNDLDAIFASSRPLILRGSVGFAAWAHQTGQFIQVRFVQNYCGLHRICLPMENLR